MVESSILDGQHEVIKELNGDIAQCDVIEEPTGDGDSDHCPSDESYFNHFSSDDDDGDVNEISNYDYSHIKKSPTMENLGEYEVCRRNDNHAEVKRNGRRWQVVLDERKCSCRVWQVKGLPCVHASAFISFTRDIWEKYYDLYFTIEKFKYAYAFGVAMMPGKDQWVCLETGEKIYPPIIKRPVGRLTKNRIIPADETKKGTDVSNVVNLDTVKSHAKIHQLKVLNLVKHQALKVNQQTYLAEFPQIDFGLAVPVFKQGDDPIDAINKMMSFLVIYSYQLKGDKILMLLVLQEQELIFQEQERKRDATWFRNKVLLVEAQGNSKVLNEEELEFLAYPGIAEAKAVLMANFSSYGSDVLYEVPHSEHTHNDMLNQRVCLGYKSFAQNDAMILSVFEQLLNQVTNCNKVNKDNIIANESLSTELERYKEWVKLLEERQNVDLSTQEKLIIDDIIQEKNAQFADYEKKN
ncbi:transposase, MuDR [Tanacetum coccineum]